MRPRVRTMILAGVVAWGGLLGAGVGEVKAQVVVNPPGDAASNIQPITPPLGFDKPLLGQIKELLDESGSGRIHSKQDDQNLAGRKALLLNYALVNYENLLKTNTSSMTAYELKDKSVYSTKGSQSKPEAPTYFEKTLNNLSLPITSRPTYASTTEAPKNGGIYNYQATSSSPQFWVDFANSTLGGGVFTDGFLQEETMFLETPELANAAAQKTALETRTGLNGPLNGSPTPLIFVNANRAMDINSELAVSPNQGPREKENWRMFPVAELIKDDVPLSKPQKINVLSMAAPYLEPSQPADQAAMKVLEDLFNTFYAGFTLAVDASKAEKFPGSTILINTGPIGAGGFHNNAVVVNIMQQLAAIVVSQQTGTQVNLKFWAYHQDIPNTEADADVQTIFTKFINTTGPGTRTISKLLEIAQPFAAELAKKYHSKP